ncbi:MAG: hypothetical protein KBG86_11310, partial [Flavobacteriales bacterium]|nr:hypothetical protein [Flavobacteriales bacterium]
YPAQHQPNEHQDADGPQSAAETRFDHAHGKRPKIGAQPLLAAITVPSRLIAPGKRFAFSLFLLEDVLF